MYIVVFVTAKDQAEAESIAKGLLDNKLAACVNICPGVKSLFLWDGKVDQAQESLLVIKTTESLFDEVSAKVKELHSYDVPEVIALPIAHGREDYLNWIKESVKN